MKDRGYGTDYAVNVTITSSIAGILIPPSHNMILYSLAAGGGISVSALFIAGIVPGVMMCLLLAVSAYVVAVRRGYPSEGFQGFRHVLWTFVDALPGLLTAVIILGGVLSGIFTVTESAAFGTIWALLVTVLVYRALSWEAFKISVAASVRTSAVVFLLVGGDGLRLPAGAVPPARLSDGGDAGDQLQPRRDPADDQRLPAAAGLRDGHGGADPDHHADLPAGGRLRSAWIPCSSAW